VNQSVLRNNGGIGPVGTAGAVGAAGVFAAEAGLACPLAG
jgi:hypothetical protein